MIDIILYSIHIPQIRVSWSAFAGGNKYINLSVAFFICRLYLQVDERSALISENALEVKEIQTQDKCAITENIHNFSNLRILAEVIAASSSSLNNPVNTGAISGHYWRGASEFTVGDSNQRVTGSHIIVLTDWKFGK